MFMPQNSSNYDKCYPSHWKKIFQHVDGKKNKKFDSQVFVKKLSDKLSDNSEKKIEVKVITPSDTTQEFINKNKLNCTYFSNTENLLNEIKNVYANVLLEISVFKNNLNELGSVIVDQCSNANNINILSKKYDDLITFFYNNVSNHVNCLMSDCCNSQKIVFENEQRIISLTYYSRNNVITNECVSKIDNIYVSNNSNFLLKVGAQSLLIHYFDNIGGIEDTPKQMLYDYVVNVLNKLPEIEKDIDKNLKIIIYSLKSLSVLRDCIFEKDC